MKRTAIGIAVAIATVAIAGTRYVLAAAAPGGDVDVRFHAAGQLTSETAGGSRLELRLRMLASLGYSGDVASGSVRCSTHPGELRCPGRTGRIELQGPEFVAGPFPNDRYPGTITFGNGTMCSVVGHMPYSLDFMSAYDPPISPPFVMYGTYECTRSGMSFDQGRFLLWEWGHSRFSRQKSK